MVWRDWARRSVGPEMIARYREACADLVRAERATRTSETRVRALTHHGNVLFTLGQVRGWGGAIQAFRDAQAIFEQARELAGPEHPRAEFLAKRVEQCAAAIDHRLNPKPRDE